MQHLAGQFIYFFLYISWEFLNEEIRLKQEPDFHIFPIYKYHGRFRTSTKWQAHFLNRKTLSHLIYRALDINSWDNVAVCLRCETTYSVNSNSLVLQKDYHTSYYCLNDMLGAHLFLLNYNNYLWLSAGKLWSNDHKWKIK